MAWSESALREYVGEMYGNAITGVDVGGDDQTGATLVGAAIIHDGICHGLGLIADAIHRLGNADAVTEMGAIENLSKSVLEVADAINGLGDQRGE